MKFLSCVFAMSVFVAAHGAETLRVVASVAGVRREEPPMEAGVYIHFIVHAPIEFQGLPITMFTVGASRASRRAEFPIGAQFAIQLPKSAVAALKKGKITEEGIEQQIDAGVNPEMISSFVVPAQIELSTLKDKPSRIEIP